MGGLVVQNNFTHGELSARLIARSDIGLYTKSAAKLRNVVVIPEGGVKRRFGTKFIYNLSSIPTTADVRSIPFEFSETVNYLFVFYPDNIAVFEDDVLVTTILTTGITAAQIGSFDFAQTTNNLIIVHPDFQMKQIVRQTDAPTFTITNVPIAVFPAHDFTNRIYNGDTFTLLSASIGTGITLTKTGAALFTDEFIGGIFIGPGSTVDAPIGFSRFTAVASGISATVDIISTFGSTSIKGEDAIVAAKAWSDLEADGSGDRGWPVSITFYQGRLWFGASKSLPQTLFGSKAENFGSFDIGTGEADDAIQVTLASSSINHIKYLNSEKSLQIFTFSSEWAIPQSFDEAITPASVAVRKMSNYGIVAVKPQVLDNETFYVKRGGKGIMAYLYDSTNFSYKSEDVSILSNDLIRQPIGATVLQGSETEDADYLFIVNDDGTIAIYQTLRDQDVSAWTLADTQTQVAPVGSAEGLIIPSKFVDASQLGNDVYFIVERTVDGSIVRYLEKLDFDLFTDATIVQNLGAPTDTITGLSALNNSTVCMRGGDDSPDFSFGTQIVTGNEINLVSDIPGELEEVVFADVGFCFTPTITTLPAVPVSSSGQTNFIPKRVNRIFVNYFESLGIKVDGVLIPNLQLGNTFSAECLTPSCDPQTGVEQLYRQGWDVSPQITITQDEPLPMTILAVGYEVTI